jgi:hypothetical protein
MLEDRVAPATLTVTSNADDPTVEGVLVFEVLLRGAVGVGAGAEVMDLASDLLTPGSGGVGRQAGTRGTLCRA